MSSIIVRNGELGMVVEDFADSKKKRFLPCGHGAYSTSNLEEISEENDDIRWQRRMKKWILLNENIIIKIEL